VKPAAKKKTNPALRALQKMLGPTFDDIGNSDLGQGLAAWHLAGEGARHDPHR
jgi:hypothetical protein